MTEPSLKKHKLNHNVDDQNSQRKITYENGDVYDGKFTDGKWNGIGKYTSIFGIIYEGEFKDGKRNGIGKYTYTEGDVYKGEFKDGKANGQGKYIYTEGDIYEGEFKDDKFNGRGKYTCTNGDIYKGMFKDDTLNGRGKRIDSKRRLLEHGIYKSGKLTHGIIYIWEDNGTCTKIDTNGNVIQPNITHIEDKIKALTEMIHEIQTKIKHMNDNKK